MPQLNEFCSKCGNNWMGCECNDYHPPFKLPDHLTIVNKSDVDRFSISRDDAIALQKFLIDVGYISWEFHEEVHSISRRLDEFLKLGDKIVRFRK